jgi:hypothetical protein
VARKRNSILDPVFSGPNQDGECFAISGRKVPCPPKGNRKRNPALVVVGNPPKGKGIIISHNVQAVLYLRDDDGVPYVHAFGYGEDEEPPEPKERGDTLMLRGLKDSTGVEAVLLSDGSILLRGPVR